MSHSAHQPPISDEPRTKSTMKTKHVIFGLVAAFLASCDRNDTGSAITTTGENHPGENHFFLTTELPPERIEGTPVPIRLRGINNTPVPAHESATPGTGGVIFRQIECNPIAAQSLPQPPPVDRDQYAMLIDNRWQTTADEPLSTFSVDVDTASYTNFRSLVRHRAPIPRDAVRLEEMVNYFDYACPSSSAP